MPDEAGLVEAESRPSKRDFTSPISTSSSEHHDRGSSDGAILDASGELRLYTPPIEALPQELLLQVFEHLVHHSLVTAGFPETQAIHRSNASLEDGQPDIWGVVSAVDRRDLRNLCLVSREFKMAATTLLYRCAQLATAESPKKFLLTLTAHPDLQPLVKHVSVPTYVADPTQAADLTYVGRITKRFNFAFSHDAINWNYCWKNLDHKLLEEFFAECGEDLDGGLLRSMMPLVPNLRTLIIPQTNLLDGPFTKDLVLRNLTTLRLALVAQNEVVFHKCSFHDAVRTIKWLSPDFIGHRFPALQRLEISTPSRLWEADLVSEEIDAAEGSSPWKYVESLKTTATTTFPMIPAEWDLMSLKQPIFYPSKLHTLEFEGPGEDCDLDFDTDPDENWDLNRFLAQKGSGLRTLSLDLVLKWDEFGYSARPNPRELFFGDQGRLTTLDKLANLTYLTVSLEALFGHADTFWDWVDGMAASPDTELAKLLPPSLRTLRIAEYIPGVNDVPRHGTFNDATVIYRTRCHNGYIYHLLQALRAFWLLRAEDRELWLRRYADLDLIKGHDGIPMGRHRLAYILDGTVEGNRRFERVLRPPEDTF